MDWYPHVTVATIVEQNKRFLLVKEESEGQIVFNQPAGHLEPNETLIQAAVRETKEETGWDVEIQHLIGVHQYLSLANSTTYVRFTFAATATHHHPNHNLDDGIICAEWMSIDEIMCISSQLRSPMVLADINRYLNGANFPLDLISALSY